MRKMILALLALVMALGGTASLTMAQDATPEVETETTASTGEDTAFGVGFDSPATYFSDRGDPVTRIAVVDIERGWQDYAEYYEPDPGIEYVAVTFTVENLSRSNIIVDPYDFSMLDGFGRNNSRSWVSVDEESGAQIFEEDAALASGETAELTIIFEMYESTEFGYFMWQPDSGIIVMVDLRDV
jgi:hypothetical protein